MEKATAGSGTRRVCEGCAAEFVPARPRHRRCWPCWRAAQQAPRPPVAPPMEPRPVLTVDDLRGALALAHPDRHPPERRDQATRVAARLTVALEVARAREAAG